MPRQSIEVDSFGHQNPIPAASRIGPMLVSSVIGAFTPGTREIPTDVNDQIENVFIHAGNILEAAGATWDDVIRMTWFVDNGDLRAAINGPWVKRFPNPESRPSRHTQVTGAPGGVARVSADIHAYIER